MSILLIGDVHGKTEKYRAIIKNEPYSLQLGDFGFASQYGSLKDLDCALHKVLGGNHDDYSQENGVFVNQPPHFLGDFGIASLNGIEFFFVRGAFSIDRQYRVLGSSYWEEEELSWQQMNECVNLYKRIRPRFVFTHDCPEEVRKELDRIKCLRNNWEPRRFPISRTTQLLTSLFDEHQPSLWVFGHHHWDWSGGVSGSKTTFVCLNELSTLRIY